MNVLYYGMEGTAANPQLGWLLISIAMAILIIGTIIIARCDVSDNWMVLILIPCTVFLVIGIMQLVDNRKPVVKATIDDAVSFIEIQKDYKCISQEGDIYTFEPRNVDIDEWERWVKEQNK